MLTEDEDIEKEIEESSVFADRIIELSIDYVQRKVFESILVEEALKKCIGKAKLTYEELYCVKLKL